MKPYRSLAFLLLRLAFCFQLIYGSQDNVLSSERMLEFEKFLTGLQVPYPAIAAPLSVYVQFIGGILLIIGFKIRFAGALIAINFIFALIIAHRGHTYPDMMPAINLLVAGMFFCLAGGGRWTLDKLIQSRRAGPAVVLKRGDI